MLIGKTALIQSLLLIKVVLGFMIRSGRLGCSYVLPRWGRCLMSHLSRQKLLTENAGLVMLMSTEGNEVGKQWAQSFPVVGRGGKCFQRSRRLRMRVGSTCGTGRWVP